MYPSKEIYNNGGDFIGKEFQGPLQSYAVKQVPTTVMNLQTTSSKERIHLTMVDMMRMILFTVNDSKEGI